MMEATVAMISSLLELRDIGIQSGNDTAAAGTGGNGRLDRFHVLAADLQIETVWILDVKTVLRIRARIKPATLQFSFHGILVPVLDRVGDVVDARRRAPLRGVARNHKRTRVAKNQVALGACISN